MPRVITNGQHAANGHQIPLTIQMMMPAHCTPDITMPIPNIVACSPVSFFFSSIIRSMSAMDSIEIMYPVRMVSRTVSTARFCRSSAPCSSAMRRSCSSSRRSSTRSGCSLASTPRIASSESPSVLSAQIMRIFLKSLSE
ncbi:hypothetical protein SDC9_149676 [bioreactor metagenome]|uniref:Uncharacterized protein n=1 Tax=bioreactor metagenome TaxID=1076179 RepID=A0A645EM72_9ZZZZ